MLQYCQQNKCSVAAAKNQNTIYLINTRKDNTMENKTDKYTIDFKDVKNRYDMFEIISTTMDFPDYFGNNWDAFWDCITDMANLEMQIDVLNFDVLKMVSEKDAAIFIELLTDFKYYYDGKWADLKEITIYDKDSVIHI